MHAHACCTTQTLGLATCTCTWMLSFKADRKHDHCCDCGVDVTHGVCGAGAATTDIIEQYVSTIRALREVDPSGVLLEAVSDPIREYLRCRKVRAHACTAYADCYVASVPCWLLQRLPCRNMPGHTSVQQFGTDPNSFVPISIS